MSEHAVEIRVDHFRPRSTPPHPSSLVDRARYSLSCRSGVHDDRPIAAHWLARNNALIFLCGPCLNAWLDNADDDPGLEPAAIHFPEGILT